MKKRFLTLPIALGALFCLPAGAMAQDGDDSSATDNQSIENNNDVQPASDADNTADTAKADSDDKKSDDKADDEEDDKSWGVSAGITFDLGLGAFTKHEYARRVRSRMGVELSGYYTIPVIDVDISLTTGFSQWLSEGGDSNGKHAFRWADSSINLSRDIWSYSTTIMQNTKFAFNLAFDLGFTLPTSQASITSKLYTQIVPTLQAAVKFDRLSFAYTISYSHSFNKYTSLTMDPDEVDVLSRHAGVELVGSSDIAQDGVLTEIELANQFMIGVSILDNLSLNVGLGFVDAWTYDNGTITKDDEYTSEYAHVGRGHQQISQGVISLGYKPADWVGLNFSMVSTQPWKTADNKTLRFPWFDTVSPSKNFTKFVIGATFSY